ncbi:hypothetical protein [Paenibacillus xylanilyticus]|uniref:hypothetical protein n=1 Tax=Paenibacillus xylanilyticus TaxID=248903 RepID=UPI0039A12E62
MQNVKYRKPQLHNKRFGFTLTLIILVALTISACSLERDEHTVQFQQLQQPNETDDLPVWLDVYSKSVNQDVYSPQGDSEFLP